ncbi:hypothetical protein ACQEV2_22205 [Streptomyces sp. CA-251387]|uniref:hypothetical protein n=1 Tax=Streptomyces sp. CA-251387 TaxID=3240064 RepID=UPI003D8A4F91
MSVCSTWLQPVARARTGALVVLEREEFQEAGVLAAHRASRGAAANEGHVVAFAAAGLFDRR